jgi:1-acyl-sn-glycerol-3-phosphate acyltransferase
MIRLLARLIAAVWYLPLFTVMTILLGAVCLVGSLFSKGFARAVSGQVWAASVLGPAFILPRLSGEENIPPGGGFIVYANHRSLIDIPAASLAIARPLSWVAKSALGRIPVFGWVLKRVHLLVEREGGLSSARTMISEAEARLAAGEILAIFPEGTRNRDPSKALLPFKKGAFIMAKHTGAALVPLAVVNSGNLWPSGSFLPHHGTISVAVGPPLTPEPGESLGALTERARKALETLYLETEAAMLGKAGKTGKAGHPGKPAGDAGASPATGPAAAAEPAGGADVEPAGGADTDPGKDAGAQTAGDAAASGDPDAAAEAGEGDDGGPEAL